MQAPCLGAPDQVPVIVVDVSALAERTELDVFEIMDLIVKARLESTNVKIGDAAALSAGNALMLRQIGRAASSHAEAYILRLLRNWSGEEAEESDDDNKCSSPAHLSS